MWIGGDRSHIGETDDTAMLKDPRRKLVNPRLRSMKSQRKQDDGRSTADGKGNIGEALSKNRQP
jgi:hypothetical protein